MERIWKRGDVFYIESTMNTDNPAGRPAVVVSSEKTYDKSCVCVVPLFDVVFTVLVYLPLDFLISRPLSVT